MGRLLRPALLTAGALALAVGFILVAAITMGGTNKDVTSRPAPVDRAAAPAAYGPGAFSDPAAYVKSLQARLRSTPGDHRSWSTLVLAYVEQARITADPSYYTKADGALKRAAKLAPNDSFMFTAKAALEAARHDFNGALAAADQALKVNPYSGAAYTFRADALTELGRYSKARQAARRADDLSPGPLTFSRLSYQAELRGDLAEATRLMRLARDEAGSSAGSFAFAAYHLGELARIDGDLKGAARDYKSALGADSTYMPAVAGEARLAVIRGDLESAEKDYLSVVQRLPLPEYLVELGELYLATDRPQLAQQQFDVARDTAALAKANGVRVDLEAAIVEADHGSPEAALTAARAEWASRQSIYTADALGWALHAAGRDKQALRYTRFATKLGTRDARLLFHHGAIEAAEGNASIARTSLRDALAIDGGAAPWREQQIQLVLDSLKAA